MKLYSINEYKESKISLDSLSPDESYKCIGTRLYGAKFSYGWKPIDTNDEQYTEYESKISELDKIAKQVFVNYKKYYVEYSEGLLKHSHPFIGEYERCICIGKLRPDINLSEVIKKSDKISRLTESDHLFRTYRNDDTVKLSKTSSLKRRIAKIPELAKKMQVVGS